MMCAHDQSHFGSHLEFSYDGLVVCVFFFLLFFVMADRWSRLVLVDWSACFFVESLWCEKFPKPPHSGLNRDPDRL